MTPGERVGPYEIVSRIGQGGMGEVWLARDARLGRDVAIKVLPSEFARDAERLVRFEREARALAALNHSSIAAVYGFENGCLAMEYVGGPGLDELIQRGPLEMDEALRIARQLAEALEAAHEKSIVHRDLKPANLKLTADGKLKVLDFGLAKAFGGDLAMAASVSQSPTVTVGTTKAGVLLGTAAYMSPEQARGRAVDKRADIWAFGCIVYEMLTGRQTFAGDSVADVLGAVVRSDPDWTLLPPSTPVSVRRMLRRCLEKEQERRLRDIGDAALELTDTPEVPVVITRRKASLWAGGAAVAGIASAAGYVARGLRSAPEPPGRPVQRFVVPLPDAPMQGRIRIARTGTRFWYVARTRAIERTSRTVFVCELDGSAPKPVGQANVRGTFTPSPDGQFIAFGTEEGIVKCPAHGGEPQLLAKGNWRADEWTDDGLILSSGSNKITALPVAGGEPRVIAALTDKDASYGTSLRMLPGGTHVLAVTYKFREPSVIVQDVKRGAPVVLAEGAQMPLYLPSGHLMYRQRGVWRIMSFDLGSLRKSGPEVQIPQGELRQTADVDSAGTLITSSEENEPNPLGLLEPDGKPGMAFSNQQRFTHLNASPDGKSALLALGGEGNVWLLDIARGSQTRMTFAERGDETPVWSPDGKRFAWMNNVPTEPVISIRAADGSGSERVLYRSKSHDHIDAWSPDGRFLLVSIVSGGRGLATVSVATGEKRLLFETNYTHRHGVFSPDGRWIAYTSDESGRNEVYVRAFPGPGGKSQVSTAGGARPRWSKDGKEIYYVSGESLMAAPVQTGGNFAAGNPRKVLDHPLGEYDILPGRRFIGFTVNRQEKHEVLLTTNFFERARQLAPRA